jgi:hypothetical protein
MNTANGGLLTLPPGVVSQAVTASRLAAEGAGGEAAQHVLDRAADHGLVTISDRRGRRWALRHWAVAATTMAANAAMLDSASWTSTRRQASPWPGSPGRRPAHPGCQQWVGKLIALDGRPDPAACMWTARSSRSRATWPRSAPQAFHPNCSTGSAPWRIGQTGPPPEPPVTVQQAPKSDQTRAAETCSSKWQDRRRVAITPAARRPAAPVQVAGPASGRRHPRSQVEGPPQGQRGHIAASPRSLPLSSPEPTPAAPAPETAPAAPPAAPPAPVPAPPPAPAPAPSEPPAAEGETPDVAKLRKESAGYRTRLREEEAARKAVEERCRRSRARPPRQTPSARRWPRCRRCSTPRPPRTTHPTPGSWPSSSPPPRPNATGRRPPLRPASANSPSAPASPQAFAAAQADPALTEAVLIASGALGKLDPTADTFAADLESACEAAVDGNPKLKIAPVAVRSGAEIPGGSGGTDQLTLEQVRDMAKSNPSALEKARKDGRLRNLGIG